MILGYHVSWEFTRTEDGFSPAKENKFGNYTSEEGNLVFEMNFMWCDQK